MTEHHDGIRLPTRLAWAVAIGCALVLATSLALRDQVSVWLGTASAGSVCIAGSLAAAGPEIRARLAPTWKRFAVGVLGGLAMAALTHVLWPIGATISEGLDAQVALLYSELRAPPGPVLATPMLLTVVVAEELLFRGLIVALLARWASVHPHGVWFVGGLATVLYALPQLTSGSLVLVGLGLACGAVWTAQRLISGSLLVPLITHATWDLIVFVIAPLPPGQ